MYAIVYKSLVITTFSGPNAATLAALTAIERFATGQLHRGDVRIVKVA